MDSAQDHLYSVYFADRNHGWAVGWVLGGLGVIVHTADGGRTWTRQAGQMLVSFHSVHFADARTGWAVGSDSAVFNPRDARAIFHTADAGATWTRQPSGVEKSLDSVCFVDARTGWAVGWGGSIHHTADGGKTWVKQPTKTLAISGLMPRDFVCVHEISWTRI